MAKEYESRCGHTSSGPTQKKEKLPAISLNSFLLFADFSALFLLLTPLDVALNNFNGPNTISKGETWMLA